MIFFLIKMLGSNVYAKLLFLHALTGLINGAGKVMAFEKVQ